MGLPLGLTLTDYRGSSFAPAKEVERSSAEEAGVVLPHADRLSDPRRRRPGWGSLEISRWKRQIAAATIPLS